MIMVVMYLILDGALRVSTSDSVSTYLDFRRAFRDNSSIPKAVSQTFKVSTLGRIEDDAGGSDERPEPADRLPKSWRLSEDPGTAGKPQKNHLRIPRPEPD